MLWQNSKSSSDEDIENRGSSCRLVFSGFGVDSRLCITSRLIPGAASRLSSCSFTGMQNRNTSLGIILSPTWGPLGKAFMLHVCECSRVFLYEVDQVLSVCTDFLPVPPVCASGAHSGAVGDWWLSCVEVGWGNGLRHLACLPNSVLTPRDR